MFSSLCYFEITRLYRQFAGSQFSCMHLKTRSGDTALHLWAVTLQVLDTRDLQSALTSSPVGVAMTAGHASECIFSADEGWYRMSSDCIIPRRSVHRWCGESMLPGLAHLQTTPNRFLCNVWSAVSVYALLCSLHINRTTDF